MLVEQLKDKEDGTWFKCDNLNINRNLVGSCLERVGEYKETIDFYQWGLKNARNDDDEKLMAERLIVSKERFANFIEKKHEKSKTSQILRHEASKLRDEYQFHDNELPEYPNFDC